MTRWTEMRALQAVVIVGLLVAVGAFLERSAGEPLLPVVEAPGSVTRVAAGEAVPLEVRAHDPDGRPLTFRWTALEGTVTGEGPRALWTPPEDFVGTTGVMVEVANEDGALVQMMPVAVNSPPTLSNLSVSEVVRPESTVSLGVSAFDPDGDGLVYRWWVGRGSLDRDDAPVVHWTAPADVAERVPVTCEVEDGLGAKARLTRTITVGWAGETLWGTRAEALRDGSGSIGEDEATGVEADG